MAVSRIPNHTRQQIADAVANGQTVHATALEYAVSKGSVHNICVEFGIERSAPKELQQAHEERDRRIAMKRAVVRETLIDTALRLLNRIEEPHKDFRAAGQQLYEVEFDVAPARSAQAYATSAAILLDKLRLELGESTARVSVEADSERRLSEALDRLIGEAEEVLAGEAE